MNRLPLNFAFVIALMFSAISGAAQITHPLTFVDKGACPFECCTYQRWTVTKDTIAYDNPSKNAKHLGVFKKGSRVRGLTGEVRTTQPGKFVITKPHEKYKKGNILWVYTPQGEGFYKVWFGGKMRVEEMDYMSGPYEQSGINCDERAECWGHLETDLKTDWWVKIRSAAGWIGWTNQTENFHGMDKCGG